jgi:hypothetical protein
MGQRARRTRPLPWPRSSRRAGTRIPASSPPPRVHRVLTTMCCLCATRAGSDRIPVVIMSGLTSSPRRGQSHRSTSTSGSGRSTYAAAAGARRGRGGRGRRGGYRYHHARTYDMMIFEEAARTLYHTTDQPGARQTGAVVLQALGFMLTPPEPTHTGMPDPASFQPQKKMNTNIQRQDKAMTVQVSIARSAKIQRLVDRSSLHLTSAASISHLGVSCSPVLVLSVGSLRLGEMLAV